MNETADTLNDFDLEKIRDLAFLKELVFVESTPSTNDLARELGQSVDLKAPALVLTSKQTAGKGRGDHRWESSSGALTFSLVIDVPETHDQAKRAGLSIATALSVVEAIVAKTELDNASIKWPNDVLIDGKKVAGILIEQVPGNPIRYVFGVGVNVNNAIHKEKLPFAVSIREACRMRLDITDLLMIIVQRMESNFIQWCVDNTAVVDNCNRRLAHRNKPVLLQISDTEIRGVCEGLDGHGRIMIRGGNGELTAYSNGTLRF